MKRERVCRLIIFAVVIALLMTGCGVPAEPGAEVEATPVVTQTPEPAPEPTPEPEPETQKLTNRAELIEFLQEQLSAGNTTPTICFTGNKNLLQSESLSQLLGIYAASYEKNPEARSTYDMVLTEFSGVRIADAFLSGDSTQLTEDELTALEVAAQIVEEVQAAAADELEMEQMLHDKVCELVGKFEGTSSPEATDGIPRHLTVIGALLDGQASSFGYADAFYTLATMAGFEVDHLYVFRDYVGKEVEMINLIRLDGAWYAVDTYFNDNVSEISGITMYNRGIDILAYYHCDHSAMHNELSLTSYEDRENVQQEIPEITGLVDLCSYVSAQVSQGIYAMKFVYHNIPGEDAFSYDLISGMAGGGEVVMLTDRENPNLHTVFVEERAGSHIAHAYLSGDISKLTYEERDVLEQALEIVNTAKSETSDPYEIEVAIHDALIKRCTYVWDDGDTDFYGIPYTSSALGLFLKGEALCQGYADAFYLVAKLAGFDVVKIAVTTLEGVGHLVNGIELDGVWYIVDPTWADPIGGGPDYVSHAYFNIGIDRLKNANGEMVYNWKDYHEVHPISEKSNPKWLYHTK